MIVAGSNKPDSRIINIGTNNGSFEMIYETYSIKD